MPVLKITNLYNTAGLSIESVSTENWTESNDHYKFLAHIYDHQWDFTLHRTAALVTKAGDTESKLRYKLEFQIENAPTQISYLDIEQIKSKRRFYAELKRLIDVHMEYVINFLATTKSNLINTVLASKMNANPF
ncbi:hypothetical protein UFOVP449_5 [uncultured Caudovirales phage]|uniref:Uncharacterized protein n=1 Tax=uncultured Caudovirales phage TaxID=2100421 RepID=A0A6J5M6C1_9CAUD|nr:hypothetical protein UFOVP449_5 [uncultured Caudovirales phage]